MKTPIDPIEKKLHLAGIKYTPEMIESIYEVSMASGCSVDFVVNLIIAEDMRKTWERFRKYGFKKPLVDTLSQGKLYINPQHKDLLKELKDFKWKEGKIHKHDITDSVAYAFFMAGVDFQI